MKEETDMTLSNNESYTEIVGKGRRLEDGLSTTGSSETTTNTAPAWFETVEEIRPADGKTMISDAYFLRAMSSSGDKAALRKWKAKGRVRTRHIFGRIVLLGTFYGSVLPRCAVISPDKLFYQSESAVSRVITFGRNGDIYNDCGKKVGTYDHLVNEESPLVEKKKQQRRRRFSTQTPGGQVIIQLRQGF